MDNYVGKPDWPVLNKVSLAYSEGFMAFVKESNESPFPPLLFTYLKP